MKKIEFNFSAELIEKDTIILPVDQDGKLPAECLNIPAINSFSSQVKQLHSDGDFSGKLGKTLLVVQPNDLDLKRVILVGMGELETLTVKGYLTALKAATTLLDHCGAEKVTNTLIFARPTDKELRWAIYQNAQVFQRSFYDYSHESRGEHIPKEPKLSTMTFIAEACPEVTDEGQAVAIGMALTQDLANMPSNYCTPSHLADTAHDLGADYGFKIHTLEREEMINMGMGAFMAVAQGAHTPPKMICLSYQGTNKEQAPIALVGKGVTFDTGGISLKPGASMDEMKYDMCGAATVLGVFKALGELKPAINVVGVIPATENMPAGNAIKPGDVVNSLSGQTIEILNTDAEGRLILCDALTYAQQTFKPAKIIDMATLTGACVVALGHHVSAVMGNNQELVEEIIAAGQQTYDRFWQMPLGEEWDEQLKSNFADMANIGGPAGGSITAAQFLARYTKDIDWAHLDIAGTAWVGGKEKGASGRPVPSLVSYLLSQAN